MLLAADLHLHSRYAKAVSSRMTLETIAVQARRKGIDLIGTGDCLQPAWLDELEQGLVEAEPGLFVCKPEFEQGILNQLPALLRRPLRFVLSTEVHCAPAGTPDLGGLHHLIYFRSFASARQMIRRLRSFGDLEDGRPRLDLTSKRLLNGVLTQQQGCHFSPAHVLNPFFSSLGSQSAHASLHEVFEDLTPKITLVETGMTSTPPMCRRISSLDRATLFSNSDAHSPENIGRECTLVDIEPSYDALFNTLQGLGPGRVVQTLKFAIERTRYFRNRCVRCQTSFDGTQCLQCGRPLITGSRDRLEVIADRSEPLYPSVSPPFLQLLPLRYVIAEICRCQPDSKAVDPHYERLVAQVGSERYILTEASTEEIAAASSPALARALEWQRKFQPGRMVTVNQPSTTDEQMGLLIGEDPPRQRFSVSQFKQSYAVELDNE